MSLVKEWNKLLAEYIKKRKRYIKLQLIFSLTMLYLLVDSRRERLKRSDTDFLKIIQDNQVPFTIVLTKIDQVSDEKLKSTLINVLNYFKEGEAPLVLGTSSRDKSGLQVLKISITDITSLDKDKKYEFEANVVQQPRVEPEKPKKLKPLKITKTINPEIEKKRITNIKSEEFARKRKFVFNSKLFVTEREKEEKTTFKRIKKMTFLNRNRKSKKSK